MISALYCGSFDPFTLGHLSVIEQAFKHKIGSYQCIEKIYICVGDNDEKTPLFSSKERVEMIKKTLKNHPQNNKIEVLSYSGLTVNLSLRLGVSYLIRGIKKNDSISSFEENKLSLINEKLSETLGAKLETITFESKNGIFSILSSSIIKKLCSLGEYIAVQSLVPAEIHQELMIKYLKPRFLNLFHAGYSAVAERHWKELVCAYQKRSYHNLSHLGYMFNMLDRYTQITGQKTSDIELAIFAHDLVYHPDRTDNEEQSIQKVLSWTGIKNTNSFKKLPNLIMATSHLENKYFSPLSPEALIKDLDLSILGTPNFFIFQNYTKSIREEYKFYNDEKYIPQRIDFLTTLLETKHLFKTKFFQRYLETQAKENLRKEIFNLKHSKH